MHITKKSTEIAANAAPTNPMCESWFFEQTRPPIKLPAPIPKLKIPEKIDIATEEDCSSVQRMVSDWNDTLNTSTVIPQTAQTAKIKQG